MAYCGNSGENAHIRHQCARKAHTYVANFLISQYKQPFRFSAYCLHPPCLPKGKRCHRVRDDNPCLVTIAMRRQNPGHSRFSKYSRTCHSHKHSSDASAKTSESLHCLNTSSISRNTSDILLEYTVNAYILCHSQTDGLKHGCVCH